jgi:CubicO group peptidase (beta-lactamase class C family)
MTQLHQLNAEGQLVTSDRQTPLEGNTVFGGTHGLFSTAQDYLKFCRMLLNNGKLDGRQFLSRKTIELMTKNHVGDLYTAPGQGFGLGFGVTTDIAKSKATGSVGQYYWSGAFCTYFFIDPKEDMIAMLMTQTAPYSNFYGNKMRQLVYQAIVD